MKSNGEKLLFMSLNKLPADNIYIYIYFFQNLTHSLSNTESYHLLSLTSPPPPSPLLLLSANNLVVLAIKLVGSSIK